MDLQMQRQICLMINNIINDAIVEVLPFLILAMKDKYKKHKYLIFAVINIFDFFAYMDVGPTYTGLIIGLLKPYIIAFVFFKDANWKRILYPFAQIAMMFCLELVGISYLIIFLGGNYNDIIEITPKYCITVSFNNMTFFVIILLVVLLWKYFVDKNKNKYYLLYLFIALYQLVLTGVFIYYSRDYTETVMWLGLLSVIMSFSFDIIMFYFIRQLERKQTVEAEMKELSLSYQREFQMYKDIEGQLQTLREQRHEFANQLQTVYAMIEQNAPAEHIKRYLADIEAFHGQD